MASGYNLRILQREIIAQAKKPVIDRASSVVERKLNVIKAQTLQEFNNNEITQELEHKGEIFAFLGFFEDEEPTEQVREFIENNIELTGDVKLFPRGDKIVVQQTVKTPSLGSAYEQASESDGVGEWTSKPWLRMIEEGIPFFSKFIFGNFSNVEVSRSRKGLQNENLNRGGSYGKRKYLSQIFANLRARISKTKR
jgi:hypothetical protein